MMFAYLPALLGLLKYVKIGAVLAPLMYVFYTINDYRSQAVTISQQTRKIEDLNKQIFLWGQRYNHINTKRGEYKLMLDKYDQAAKNAGCYPRLQQQLKLLVDTKWKDDVLNPGGG